MKPRIRSPLRKGKLVYHGTSVKTEFDMLPSKSWVSDSAGVAEYFAKRYTWNGYENPRVLVFRIVQSPRLAVIKDMKEWDLFREWVADASNNDEFTFNPYELAEDVCFLKLDGWHIEDNYSRTAILLNGEGSDTLLCKPSNFLELVEVRKL